MRKQRVFWHAEERAAIVAVARRLMAGGKMMREAYNEAQNLLAPERRRHAGYASEMNHAVRAALMVATTDAEAKLTADLKAAEALLADVDRQRLEQAATIAKLRGEFAAVSAREAEASAKIAKTDAAVGVIVDIAVAIAKRVILELGVVPGGGVAALNPGDCPPARVPNPGVAAFNLQHQDLPERKMPPKPKPKPKVLIVAGSENAKRTEERWRQAAANVDLRIERATKDGRVFVPKGYDAAVLVHGVRHATSDSVRAVYKGAPLATPHDVPRVLGSIITRLRGIE